jgi:hypothetical protein
LNLKNIKSSLQTAFARHGKSCIAAACGSLAVFGLVGIWSMALAQQPYPAPYPAPYPPPGARPPPPGYQQAYPQPGNQQPPAYQGRRPSGQELRCMQLRQELANDWVQREQGQNDGPKLEKQIRKIDRIFQSTRAKAERTGCYQSNFIFGRSLVRTPKCLRLNRKIEDARRQLESLQAQRSARSGGQNRRKNDLIAALARAGCGSQYQQETRRRSSGGFMSWFEEDFWDTKPRRGLETSRIEQFATYRTLCVRSCDGYYFPVSFSTLPGSFPQDVNKCQSLCAAPAELYVYRNPGEDPAQMVSSDGRQAYNDHPNAWRYRKEYVKGCSCKSIEYDPNEIALVNEKAAEEKEQASAQGGGAQFKDKAPAKKKP